MPVPAARTSPLTRDVTTDERRSFPAHVTPDGTQVPAGRFCVQTSRRAMEDRRGNGKGRVEPASIRPEFVGDVRFEPSPGKGSALAGHGAELDDGLRLEDRVVGREHVERLHVQLTVAGLVIDERERHQVLLLRPFIERDQQAA